MKSIVKGDEPEELSKWKALVNDDWQPTFAALANPQKKAVFDALKAEQGYICCYCERRLVIGDCHIEHFQPQHDATVDALDFGNMLCSCQDRLKKGDPRHCGNLKGNWFDDALLVSPFDPDCEDHFSFTGDGGIHASSEADAAAKETITKLGLGIPKLNALRSAAIAPFLDEDLTDDDVRNFVDGYLQKTGQGEYNEFLTTIKHLFTSRATA